jgi:hypothetical protein
MTFVCVFSYGFYLIVERPSHRLARRIAVSRDERTREDLAEPSLGSHRL